MESDNQDLEKRLNKNKITQWIMGNSPEPEAKKDWKDWIPIHGLFRYGLVSSLGEERFRGNEIYYFGYLFYQVITSAAILYGLSEVIKK